MKYLNQIVAKEIIEFYKEIDMSKNCVISRSVIDDINYFRRVVLLRSELGAKHAR